MAIGPLGRRLYGLHGSHCVFGDTVPLAQFWDCLDCGGTFRTLNPDSKLNPIVSELPKQILL